MTTTSLPITDAELAAQWSIQATREGRYELAEAVLRIAAQAYRAEQQRQQRPDVVEVPFAGHTRIEAPARPRLRVATHGHSDPDVLREADAPAATQVMAAAGTVDRRCTFKILKGNVYADCHGACYWLHATVGDASAVGRWEHVDDELNQDHPAYVEA